MSAKPNLARSQQAVSEMLDRLSEVYEPVAPQVLTDPMDEVFRGIMGRNGPGTENFPALKKVRKVFPTWLDLLNADKAPTPRQIEEAGLSSQKADKLMRALIAIYGETDESSLELLRKVPTNVAIRWMRIYTGLGERLALNVLCYSLGHPTFPVDPAIHRVSERLGLVPNESGINEAPERLRARVSRRDAYRFHVLIKLHGEAICQDPKPKCESCPVTDLCPWFKRGGPVPYLEINKKLKAIADALFSILEAESEK